MPLMKNWSITHHESNDEYTPPERMIYKLQGNVYDSPKFRDGTFVKTSRIIAIVPEDGIKAVYTVNSTYFVHECDVDPEYERCYPGAYDRLSMDYIRE